MSDNQIARYLRTEELYQQILDMVCENVFEEIGETGVRGKLDALLSQGKIEGRMTGHTVHGHPVNPREDNLIEGWQRIVDSV